MQTKHNVSESERERESEKERVYVWLCTKEREETKEEPTETWWSKTKTKGEKKTGRRRCSSKRKIHYNGSDGVGVEASTEVDG